MKALHITATWVMLVEDPDPWPHDLEAVSDEITGQLYAEFGEDEPENIRDIRVFVQHMPGEYNQHLPAEYSERVRDREEAKQQIENDTDQGVSFLDTMAGPPKVRHPWDDGMWVFPEDHPLAPIEREAHRQGNRDTGERLLNATKELPRGNQ